MESKPKNQEVVEISLEALRSREESEARSEQVVQTLAIRTAVRAGKFANGKYV